MPPRIVHLLGGLRGADSRAGKAIIQLSPDQRLAEFPTSTYAELYAQLRSLRLEVLGVEFLTYDSMRDELAPDWQCASPSGGFKIREQRIWWDGARHVAANEHLSDVASLAARISSYLALLNIRVLQLSEAYNRTLCGWSRSDPKGENLFFDNSFRPYIDAAIHAFVADAASFRDLLAEATWKLVLNEKGSVRKLAKFLVRAKSSDHPLAKAIIDAGQSHGWLWTFAELRNHITHVAPVGHASAFQFCQLRTIGIGKIRVHPLHYPVLDESGSVQEFPESDRVDSRAQSKALWKRYERFCNTSQDALHYCWTTLGKLVDLLGQIGSASGLPSETPTLTEADLLGKPRLRVGDITRVHGAG